MDTSKILWSGKSELQPNIWGLNYEGGRLSFNFVSGTGMSQGPGYLAIILWSIIGVILGGIILSFYSTLLSISYMVLFSFLVFYWTIIREIKYYQLCKNTVYQIDEDFVKITYKYLWLKRVIEISNHEIKQVHLVKYQQENGEKASIWIYTEKKVESYFIAKKERSNIARLEMISNYSTVYNLLTKLRDKTDGNKV